MRQIHYTWGKWIFSSSCKSLLKSSKNIDCFLTNMFSRGNAARTNRNFALFTVELTLFGCLGSIYRINEGGQELLKWKYGMNFLFLSEMIFYIVFTQMYVTDTKLRWGLGIYI